METQTASRFIPYLSRPLHDGVQKIYWFDNGYGASVVRHMHSYGVAQWLWELAVIVGNGAKYDLCYDTPITDDVLGRLTDEEVDDVLARIEALPKRGEVTE